MEPKTRRRPMATNTKPATPATPATKSATPKGAKKDERIPLKYAEKLVADGIISAAKLEEMKKEGKVTSGVGFGGESVNGQLVEMGVKDTAVSALFNARDTVNEMLEKLPKADGFKVIIYLKHPKAETPADAKK